MAHTISPSQKPLSRATIARFDNPPPCLKSVSKVFPESHGLFGLYSYSNFLFLPWANPDYNRALEYLASALQIAQNPRVDLFGDMENILYDIAEVNLRQGHLTEVIEHFQILLEKTKNNPKLRARVHYGLARLALAQGDVEKAHDYGKASLQVLEKMGKTLADEVQAFLVALPSP